MRKTSEQKAFEAYPMDEYEFDKAKKSNIERSRYAYIKGYDQAMQDFLEKAEKWLEIHMPLGEVSHESVYDCIQEFKKYIQDEI